MLLDFFSKKIYIYVVGLYMYVFDDVNSNLSFYLELSPNVLCALSKMYMVLDQTLISVCENHVKRRLPV